MKKTKAAVSKAKQQVKTAVKQTKQVVKKQVLPAMKKAAQATTKAVKNAVKPKNLLNTLQTGLDIVGMVPVVGEVADGVNGIIYAARGDKVNAALSFGAMIPVVGNAATAGKWVNKGAKAAKGISESAQKANKGLLGNVKEKVNKQVANAKTQIQARVDVVKQQLRQLGAPQMELAGVNVGRISDTGTVGKNTSSSSPKPSNSQPPQNGSNKKPAENKGTGKDVTFKKGYDTHLIEVEGFKAKPNIGIKGGHNLENFEKFILDNFGNQVKDINQAVTKKSHPDISGIYEVKYKLPVYDGLSTANGGKGNFTGQWKEYKNPKTVYDPKVFPDEQILKLGRDAMEEGISNNRITHGGGRSPSDLVEGYVDVNGKQLKFMGFKDKNTGEISNFFPVLD
ncbi:hypothetical protein RKS58_15430 [Lysinibacillus capsici]|uniref:EndoU domain-containing protein n=1 Tax=Lysinibacillus capsici TaxID=2115968 RepID=UPI0028BD258C|nr:EndoU domain-containing protein [Lysinibacillus capsici]WNN74776.1 hypothetical protein RKS58_15430 [Lysinibacillus capsici]